MIESEALHSEGVQKLKGIQKSKDVQNPRTLRSYMDQKLLGIESQKLRSQVSFRRRRRSEAELQRTIRSQRFKDHQKPRSQCLSEAKEFQHSSEGYVTLFRNILSLMTV